MRGHYFFELPVYRIEKQRYDSELTEYISKHRIAEVPGWDAHSYKEFGGAWRFNEIIGYIRLYFLGWQVRGEYFSVDAKRIVKTRKKQFVMKTEKLGAEVNMFRPTSSEEILAYVRKYVARCKQELPRRIVDDATFEAISPHIDWLALYRSGLPAKTAETSS